ACRQAEQEAKQKTVPGELRPPGTVHRVWWVTQTTKETPDAKTQLSIRKKAAGAREEEKEG
ncbi:hypothetical protein, partial [Comamonas thiooxydans]|uniref:hypothetical protein n=1 Tax=Comamonas thiooxydans TaxID=363952 RepID=UPI001A9430E6